MASSLIGMVVYGSEKDLPTTTTTSSPTPGTPPSTNKAADRDLDGAYRYINDVHVGALHVGSVNLAALRRKIDWHIVPIMFLCYTMQFLDKVNINVRPIHLLFWAAVKLNHSQYAAVMGINADLKLQGNDFSNASTAFFIAYLFAEIPNGKPVHVI
jgi:hypothetical protein